MHIRFRFERLNRVFGKWWRTYVADECPDARTERLMLEQDIALREAMRAWLIKNQTSQISKAA